MGNSPHIDGFQTWDDEWHLPAINILIERNLIVLTDYQSASANCHGFMLREASYITIRNNIVIAHGGTETGGNGGTCHHLMVINNNFIGKLTYLRSNWPLGISLENCPYSTVKNNIVYDQVGEAIYLTGGTYAGLDIGYNCVYNSDGSTPGGKPQSCDLWRVNPQFANPGDSDYHLLSNSPCFKARVAIPDNTIDYEGNPRSLFSAWDIGAYECRSFPMLDRLLWMIIHL